MLFVKCVVDMLIVVNTVWINVKCVATPALSDVLNKAPSRSSVTATDRCVTHTVIATLLQ